MRKPKIPPKPTLVHNQEAVKYTNDIRTPNQVKNDGLVEEYIHNVNQNLASGSKRKDVDAPGERKNRVNNIIKSALIGTALLTSVQPSNACDQTLYISPDGNICDLTEC